MSSLTSNPQGSFSRGTVIVGGRLVPIPWRIFNMYFVHHSSSQLGVTEDVVFLFKDRSVSHAEAALVHTAAFICCNTHTEISILFFIAIVENSKVKSSEIVVSN